jgi:WD40 repeat protein
MFAHCSRPIPDPRDINPDVPAACTALIRRALAKYPAQRFGSAAEMLAALDAILAEGGEAAPPPAVPVAVPAPPRPRTITRRPFVVAGALTAVLAVAPLWAFWPRSAAPTPADGETAGPVEPAVPAPRWAGPFRETITPRGRFIDLEGRVETAAFSHDGRWLAAGTSAGVCVWDCATGESRQLLPGRGVRGVAFSPDDDALAVAAVTDAGAEVVRFDPASGAERRRLSLGGIAGPNLRGLAYSTEGPVIAAVRVPAPREAGGGLRFCVWELEVTGAPVALRDVGPVSSLAFSADGRTLAVGGPDGRLALWVRPGRRPDASFPLEGEIGVVAFSPDGATVVAVRENALVFCNPRTGPVRAVPHSGAVQCAAFSTDGRLLALGQGNAVTVADVRDGRTVRSLAAPAGRDAVRAVAFSPDGEVLAAAYRGGTLALWDVGAGAAGPSE